MKIEFEMKSPINELFSDEAISDVDSIPITVHHTSRLYHQDTRARENNREHPEVHEDLIKIEGSVH